MFGRATIRLGIGPHSSFVLFTMCDVHCIGYAAVRSFDGQVAINLSSVFAQPNTVSAD